MEVLYTHCAALDVHKDTVVAAVRISRKRKVEQTVRTFATTTSDLLALSDWLSEQGVTHVVMEATGVYWKPVWHVLEGSFELVLANPTHIRNVPGRKSDVSDCIWMSELLAHGLIRGSFVPPEPIQHLRDLTRTRKQLGREIVQHTQRIQKTLEDANVKLTGLVSDLLGVSGRAILRALIAGESDPERLAGLLKGRLKAKRPAVIEALRARVTDHHRFLLGLHLDQIEALEQSRQTLEERLEKSLEPLQDKVELLKTMPGVSDTVAQVLLAEIGDDMTRFPSVGHLLSWAGLCPRNDESAGKRRSTRLRKGAPWLKTTLVQAAWAAVRCKDIYLRAQFLRLKSRRGPKKAIIAVAASMLGAAYHMLRDNQTYQELGAAHFDRRDQTKLVNRLIRRAAELGFHVEVRPAA